MKSIIVALLALGLLLPALAAAAGETPPISDEAKKKMERALDAARDKAREIAEDPPVTREDLEEAKRKVKGIIGGLRDAAEEAGITPDQMREAVEEQLDELGQPAPTADPEAPTPLEEFQAAIGETGDLARYNRCVTGDYRMRWDLGRITTNVNGEEETMTIYRLANLELADGTPIPPELVERIRELAERVRLENEATDLSLSQPEIEGAASGAVDPNRNAFLVMEEETLEDENLGSVGLRVLGEGGFEVPGSATRLEGTLTFQVTTGTGGQAREFFIRLPFTGRKVAP